MMHNKIKIGEMRAAERACLMAMIEIMKFFEEYSESMTIVGGWFPFFSIQNAVERHVGSQDIDIAIDTDKIPKNVKKSIFEILKENKFVFSEDNPYAFYRKTTDPYGDVYYVKIDFLTTGPKAAAENYREVSGIKAYCAPGCSLAMADRVKRSISIAMPDGTTKKIAFNFTNVVPFLTMKGTAIASPERLHRKKDAYDIYYTIKHFSGGPSKLAEEFQPYLNEEIVQKGLSNIRVCFSDVDMFAPKAVASVLGLRNKGEQLKLMQEAFDTVQGFFKELDWDNSLDPEKEMDFLI